MTPLPAMAGDIKIAHSVFALPFALLAAAMAAWPVSGEPPVAGSELVWAAMLVVAAMVSARTAAMLSNRLLDRHLDAANPRTASRPLAAGTASTRAYLMGWVLSVCAFEAVCLGFWIVLENFWPLVLSVPVLAWICAYGLLKRFTFMCHLWLGASLALSVPAAALAVDPESLVQGQALWLLACMVLCWVAGFDVIYALQDVRTDVAQGLHSMPSRLGVRNALWCSRALHTAAAALLICAWWSDERLGTAFLIAAIAAAGLLLVEHLTVHRWGTSKMALTFFTLNGILSCLLGVAGIVDVMT